VFLYRPEGDRCPEPSRIVSILPGHFLYKKCPAIILRIRLLYDEKRARNIEYFDEKSGNSENM
jgi:hypothetical protein